MPAKLERLLEMTKLTPDLAIKYKYCLVGCLQGPKAITMDAANPSASASSVSSLIFEKVSGSTTEK